ncbi:cytokine receptor [Musca vetustissima]|uniref:cytokine receptor n=1 Tax=Musca vetustissima TaxID=27455 RepID=UPI002AB7899F|nr:cytokine receptor [Musca vetustissima]
MTNLINSRRNIIVWLMFVLSSLALCRAGKREYRMFYSHPGETQPVTIEAAIGDSFNITCYMNPKAFPGKNSSSLHFVNGRTNEVLPRENILILNSSSIVYMVRNASEQQTEYRCKCGPDAIMETKVFVGTAPKAVTNFSCSSYDFDHMICNFTKPPNPILTTYNVSFYNDMPNYIFQPDCNYDDRSLVVCNISLKDRNQEFYHFIIESKNALVREGDRPLTQYFAINNFEVMIPSRPGENIRIDNISVDGIRLTWQMVKWEKYRNKGLQWEVLIEPENATTIRGDAPYRDHNEMKLRVTNLPYAYWHYDLKLRVRVKHPKAQWSDQFVLPFRTAAKRPQRPPRMDPGSFYINSAETMVTVYWEELPTFEYNGDNFTYVVRSIRRDGNFIDLRPITMEHNLAVFPWRKTSRYEFDIGSRNHMGDSLETSRLIIYPFDKTNARHHTPRDINNVYHANNRTYTLTWSKPPRAVGLKSYTVFWCYPKRALPNECKESMHFQEVPATQLNFTTEKQNPHEEHTLNLAVSANYDTFNTGLHWTACTMDVNSDLVKADPELTSMSNSIKVQWSVERVCTSILLGFNLTYCEVADNVPADNATCLDHPHTVTLAKKDKVYNIEDLKPFTMYKVSMYMFSRNKVGKPSDPQLMRTLEGAPSPPRHLKVYNVTKDSAWIKWMEPSHKNGHIRKYIIMLNNDRFEVNGSTLEYPLTDLETFTSYKVYVLAQTVEISDTSNDVHFTTAIGAPTPPGQAATAKNSSIIQWSKPLKPNGRLEFYEVMVTQKRNNDVIRRKKSIIMGGGETSCAFQEPECIGAEYKTVVEVRAVNAALLTHEVPSGILLEFAESYSNDINDIFSNDNEDLSCGAAIADGTRAAFEIQRYFNRSVYHLYKSPWQILETNSCSASALSKITTIALVVIAMSLGVMAALYMARKKYNKMANIQCTLPAGLESYFTKENTGGGFTSAAGVPATHVEKSLDLASKEAEWLSAGRMHEYNFRNEHHHLLASLGNDSGYLGAGGERGLCGGSSTGNDNMADNCEIMDKEKNISSSVDSLVESTSDESESSSMPPHHSKVVEHTPLNNDSGYIKHSLIQPWQAFDEQNIMTTNVGGGGGGGYISVQSLQALQPPTSAAVAPAPLSSATTTNPNNGNETQFVGGVGGGAAGGGYTTLEDLAKLQQLTNPSMQVEIPTNPASANQLTNESSKTTNANSQMAAGGGGLISGYVTQQDLNIFGQQQQQQ